MTTLKQGDLVKNSEGRSRRVMEVCGTILPLSFFNNHAEYSYTTTEAQLKKDGYTWDTPTWEATLGMEYWFIDGRGQADSRIWNDDRVDNDRKNFLGIYQTEKLCEASVLEIKSKLGK